MECCDLVSGASWGMPVKKVLFPPPSLQLQSFFSRQICEREAMLVVTVRDSTCGFHFHRDFGEGVFCMLCYTALQILPFYFSFIAAFAEETVVLPRNRSTPFYS